MMTDPAHHGLQRAWPATRRWGYRAAPVGGLALVQDFVNTRARAGQIDLLRRADHAQTWADVAVAEWAAARGRARPRLDLTDDDVRELLVWREHLDDLIAGAAAPTSAGHPSISAGFQVTDGQLISLLPHGTGWSWLRSAMVLEIVFSQESGTWSRLKQCRRTDCQGTFYDITWDKREINCTQHE